MVAREPKLHSRPTPWTHQQLSALSTGRASLGRAPNRQLSWAGGQLAWLAGGWQATAHATWASTLKRRVWLLLRGLT